MRISKQTLVLLVPELAGFHAGAGDCFEFVAKCKGPFWLISQRLGTRLIWLAVL
jgi:hypothetical protein